MTTTQTVAPAVPYDSRLATHEHIAVVQGMIGKVIIALTQRLLNHDKSKLTSPEVEYFDKYTPRLRGLVYNSPEYHACLAEMQPGLNHHYAVHRHHPQHFPRGIHDMSLIDLLEMLIDWRAATFRHDTGNIIKSIEENQKRFGYGDELKQIFLNTLPDIIDLDGLQALMAPPP